jgi:hypothetical protein
MLRAAARILIGLTLIAGLLGGALWMGHERPGDAEVSLAQVCAGMVTDRKAENALFEVRAQSNGGSDPVCDALEEPLEGSLAEAFGDDDLPDGLTVVGDGSQRSASHRGALTARSRFLPP